MIEPAPETVGTNSLMLDGCYSGSLLGYLKALGVFRLVALQRDASVRLSWDIEAPVLHTCLDRHALTGFFLHDYRPTPFLAPWNGGSGFYRKGVADKVLGTLERATSPRLADYVAAIHAAKDSLEAAGVGGQMLGAKKDEEARKAKVKAAKVEIIRGCRATLPESALPALDAMVVLGDDRALYAPILGSGGNDGNMEFSSNFIQRLIEVVPLQDGAPVPPGSTPWLEDALFGGGGAPLRKAAIGQFSPRGIGGPNSGPKVVGDSLVNPWDYVLLIEGCALVAGAATRRLRAGARGTASFPFSVQVSPAGVASVTDGEGKTGRGELWLPVWDKPASYPEVQHLFGEARAEVGGRQAATGLDFARAAASLGVDRGVAAFERFAFLSGQRSGNMYLGVGLGRMPVSDEPRLGHLRQTDAWVGRVRSALRENPPASAARAVRQTDEAILAFCKLGGPRRLQDVLIGLGRLEGFLAKCHRPDGGVRGEGRSDTSAVPPLQDLDAPRWIEAADDGSAEFRLAAALASVCDETIGPVRCQLEPVVRSRGRMAWAGAVVDSAAKGWSRKPVWGLGGLAANLAAVLERRCLDGEARGSEALPVAATVTISLGDIAAFLSGALDEARVEGLLWAMASFKWDRKSIRLGPPKEVPDMVMDLPRAYALMKLLFLPFSLPGAGRSAGDAEQGRTITKGHGQILGHLRAGRLADATKLALNRLTIEGVSLRGAHTSRSPVFTLPSAAAERLAGALLVPVSPAQTRRLGTLVLRQTQDA